MTSSGSGLVFHNTFSAGVSQAYINCAIAAEQTLDALATNSDNVYVTFNAANDGTNTFLAQTNAFYTRVTFTQLTAALASHEHTPVGAAAVASFGSLSDPSNGAGFDIPTAYAVMLGLASATTSNELTITLNTSYNWSFGQDVTNTLTHELSEGGMGRVGGLGVGLSGNWSTMDLFSYNGSGSRDFSSTDASRYFSFDGGAFTSQFYGLSFFAANSGNDAADFQQLDVFGTGDPGETNFLSNTDVEMLRALGWNAPAVSNDVNGFGTSDILFMNGTTFTEWESEGSNNSFASNVIVGGVGAGWSLAGTGDFNGDGFSDLIWQNGGTFAEWQSTGSGFTPNVYVASVGAGWTLAGVGDFNGDGKSDLIFQNGGTFTEWQSTGNSFTPNVYVASVGAGWTLAGVGDFNGDGKSDLIWQNGGLFTEWQSTGNGFTPNVYVGSVGAGWTLAGVGDFTGNGESDLIWENGGVFAEWQSTGNGFTPNVYVGNLGPGWSIAAIGDFSGNGMDDILFRNTNGTFTEWQSTGNGFIPNVYVNSTVGNAWALEYSPTGGAAGASGGTAVSGGTTQSSSNNAAVINMGDGSGGALPNAALLANYAAAGFGPSERGAGSALMTNPTLGMEYGQSSLVANPMTAQVFGSHQPA